MCSRKDRVEVYPLCAVEDPTVPQTRKQSRHHDTRFPRATGAKHSQQACVLSFFLLTRQRRFHRCRQLLNEAISSKEITGIVFGEGVEPLVGVARDCWEHEERKLRP